MQDKLLHKLDQNILLKLNPTVFQCLLPTM